MTVKSKLFLGALFGGLAAAGPAPADRSEAVFWQSVADSTDGAEFCAYLAAYPNGKFAPLARIRAKKFGGACAGAGAAGSRSGGPAAVTPADRPEPARRQERKSFFASGNYFDGKLAFDARDYEKAFRLWKKSADEGEAEAQGFIGSMYHNGLGVQKDFKKAMEWYVKAALKGVAQAQFGIGNLYGDGLGVEKDYVQARMWFAISANGGNDLAQFNLDKISRRMNADDIAKSEQMALDWLKKHKLL